MAKKNTLEIAATGRRKTSVARVRMVEGAGKVTVNGQDSAAYFNTALQQELLKKPFLAAGNHRINAPVVHFQR